MPDINPDKTPKTNIPVKKPGIKIKTKAPVVKVRTLGKKKIFCRICKNPITETNTLLTCKSCNKNFCDICEKKIEKQFVYQEGDKKHDLEQTYPLCSNCYKLNINRQIEQITMKRRFKQLNDSLPSDPEIWYSTGERFINSEKFYLASMCFNEAFKLDKNTNMNQKIVKNWEKISNKLLSESRLVEAVQCLDEALILDSKLPPLWLLRGKTLEALARFKEAIASFNKVLEMEDKNKEALSRKGYLLAMLKDKHGFDQCFSKAVENNPNEILVWHLKAKGHLILDESQQAFESAEHALKLEPENFDCKLIKCEALNNLNNSSDALVYSEKVLTIEPRNVLGLKCKGDALYKLGKNEDAMKIYTEILQLDPYGDNIDPNIIQTNLQNMLGGTEGSKPDEIKKPGTEYEKAQRPLTPEETYLQEAEKRRKEELEKKQKEQKEQKDLESARSTQTEKQEPEHEREESVLIKKGELITEFPTIEELKILYNQLKSPEESTRLDQAEVRTFIQDQSKLLKQDLKELKETGHVISNLTHLYKKAGSKFKKENYLEALRIIIDVIEVKEEYEKKIIESELNKISNKLIEMKMNFPVEELQKRINQIKSELNEKKFNEIKEMIIGVKKQIALIEKYYPKAKQLIKSLEQKIKTIEQAGFNVSTPMNILNQMKQCFETNDYQKLPELKNDCLKSIEKSRDIYKNLLSEIKTAQKQYNLISKQGMEDDECKKLLKKAKMLVISGDYEEARKMISGCVERTNKLIEE